MGEPQDPVTTDLWDIVKVRGVQTLLMSSGFVWAVWMIKVFVLRGASICVTFPP